MRRVLVALGAALLAATGAVLALGNPGYAATGLHAVGTDIYEANAPKCGRRGRARLRRSSPAPTASSPVPSAAFPMMST